VSDASNVGGCSPNCQMTLNPQTVNITGGVYNPAVYNPGNGQNTTSVTLAARVGDTTPFKNISVSNDAPTTPVGFSEGLKVTAGAAPANFTTSGSTNIANLAAGATDGSSLRVGVQTGTAGTFTGTLNLALASTGVGTSGLPDLSLGSQGVNLSGKVYTPAQATTTTSVNFGIVHKGDTVQLQAISVQNSATVTALNDVLIGGITGVTGPFTGSGTLASALVAGGPADTTSLKVGLNTTNAGVFSGATSGTATLGLSSHDADLADLPLSPILVTLTGQVNNFANPQLTKASGSGTFSGSGTTFTLAFGSINQNSGILEADLRLTNDIPGFEPGDLLDASLTSALGSFSLHLDPSQSMTNLGPGSFFDVFIDFDTSMALGPFNGMLTFDELFGHNPDFRGALPDIPLGVSGTILQPGATVAEPGTLLLLLSGLGGVALAGWRRRRRS